LSGEAVRTTAQVRAAIQASTESLKVLAARYHINPKTVAKWRQRASCEDLRSGPRPGTSGSLSAEEEDMIVRFRQHTLLPLDDCLYALQAQIPHLRRSTLHRCLQRHGISQLARAGDTAAPAGDRQAGPPGCLHLDRSQVRTGDATHFLFNAIDQASKFVFVWKGARGGPDEAAQFLAGLADRLPFAITQVVTLEAEPFVSAGATNRFGRTCAERGIEHRLTAAPHPWTRGRGARMGRLIEDSIDLASEAYLDRVLGQFVHAYNFRRRLKTLGGHTPFAFLCRAWLREPNLFLRDPHHEMLGLEIMQG
jgi:transposase InsO family protein